MNNQQQTTMTFIQLLLVIVFAMLSRFVLPPVFIHIPNLSATNAATLFCGANFSNRRYGLILVLSSICLSDFLLNRTLLGVWTFIYPGWYWQYISYLLIYFMGTKLVNKSSIYIGCYCITTSVLFFIISNFGVWVSGQLYTHTFSGLTSCFINALPFFKYTIGSDLLFVGILFGLASYIKADQPSFTYSTSKVKK